MQVFVGLAGVCMMEYNIGPVSCVFYCAEESIHLSLDLSVRPSVCLCVRNLALVHLARAGRRSESLGLQSAGFRKPQPPQLDWVIFSPRTNKLLARRWIGEHLLVSHAWKAIFETYSCCY